MFPQEGEIDAATAVSLNEAFEITRQHVDLNINSRAARVLADHGHGLSVWDDVDLEFRRADRVDRKTDAVDGDRSFRGNVPAKRRRNRDDDALRAPDGVQGNDLAHAVDMARHDVTVERVARFQRRPEIHARARGKAAERGDGQRRGRHVGGEVAATDGDGREADPVDGDAAADGERRYVCAADLDDESRIRARIRALRDPSDAFHQSREHSFSLRAQAPATLLTRAVIRKSPPILETSSKVTRVASASDSSAGTSNIPRAAEPSTLGAI